ncbi:MAG: capsular polysaccharide biosynthesis protein [Microgenomates group bacterium Gr01-1014_5]|nr:MAG: capsular polysaccharide biosynthesis protein [Microgenomates group bacterium Gr01-1014_5]
MLNRAVVLIREKIITNPLFSGSVLMLLGTNVYHAGQFLFHIIAGRVLGKAQYGDLAVLMNILGIFALVQISLGLTVVKFIASERDEKKVSGLVKWALNWSTVFGLIIAIFILVSANFISDFLNLSQSQATYYLAPVIFFYSLVSITRSILQGMLKFGWYVVGVLSEVGVKLILVMIFFTAGYAVVGGMLAVSIAVALSFLVGLFPLRKYFLNKKAHSPNSNSLFKYSIPAFLQGIALTSMYSTDLFLVKHYFSPETAGLYAGLTKLGSIVFFAAFPIAHVMFPLIAKRHSHGESYHSIFYLSLLLTAGIAGIIILFYLVTPKVFLSVLGSGFLEGSSMLWWFGLFMGLLSFAMLFIQFYLSIGKTFVVGYFIAAAFLQITLIVLFHNNLLQVVQMSILSVALLVICLLVYFPYHAAVNKKCVKNLSL